jgi:uncharacterized glyoxalase superfamily protein PhnB
VADQTPNIFPALRYGDPEAARRWLMEAFGFSERAVYRDGMGAIHHAEMSLGPGTIMFGGGYPNTHSIYVAVDDVEGHCRQATAAGAAIVRELEDTPYGSREYSARDLEGNMWSFGTYRPEPAS